MNSEPDALQLFSSKTTHAWVWLTVWLTVWLLFAPPATAQLGDGLALNGFYRFYSGVRLDRSTDFLVLRNRARLNLRYGFDRGRLYLSSDVRQNFTESDGERPYRLDHDLREAFLDVYLGPFDVRLGLQQIVWGEADGAFITDVLSPLDLSEFLTQDFSDIRQGIPALRVSYFSGAWTATGVWVARPLPSRLPRQDSPWSPIPEQVFGLPVRLDAPEQPDATLGNGEAAFRLEYAGWPRTTVRGMYLYGWNRRPTVRKQVRFETGLPAEVRLTPIAYRRHVVGLSFESALPDPFVVRGEAAFESHALHDRRLPDASALIVDPPDPAALQALASGLLVESPGVQAMLGVERGFGRHLVRIQALADALLDHDDRFVNDAFTPAATALWIGRYRRETLTGQFFAYLTLDEGYWVNPSITYNVADGLNAGLGVQWFGGPTPDPSAGVFSFALYDANDFAYIRVQYDF